MAAGLGDDATRRAALEALPRVCRTRRTCSTSPRTSRASAAGAAPSAVRSAAGTPAGRRSSPTRRSSTAAGRLDPPRPAAARAPGGPRRRRQPDARARPSTAACSSGSTRGGEHRRPAADRQGFARAQRRDAGAGGRLVREYGLPREAVSSEHLTYPDVWEALLEDMPMTALIRNLAKMTRSGCSRRARTARQGVAQLGDRERIRGARPPVAVLSALRTYAAGHGVRGQSTWTPVPAIVDALDDAFYWRSERRADRQAVPARARRVGLDDHGAIAGVPGLTPRVASAAMALVTAATETQYVAVGFTPARAAGRRGCAASTGRRGHHAARDLAAAAARRRAARDEQPAVRRHRLRAADAVRARDERAIDTFVILHGQRDVGG